MSKTESSGLSEPSDLSPRVKEHLNQVYGTLSIGCLTAAVACMYTPAHIAESSAFLIFSFIAAIGLLITMALKSGNHDHGTKFICFLLLAAISGAELRPLIDYACEVDPVIIINALVYTGGIFVSFTLVSFMAAEKSSLFVGGFLASMCLGITFGYLISWVLGTSFISYFAYNLLNLFIFSCYVIYDTHLIIEKAEAGDYDYNQHAFDLFVDLIRIFIHIVKILIALSTGKSDD